jgi:hypothetical protein
VTKTEAAMQALAAALAASADLPTPERDLVLDQALEPIAEETGVSHKLLIRDGAASDDGEAPLERSLGRGEGRFDIAHAAEVEWIVAALDRDDLASLFDAGLEAIAEAIEADRSLGGIVEDADLPWPPTRSVFPLGARTVKCATLRVLLQFQSPRPF